MTESLQATADSRGAPTAGRPRNRALLALPLIAALPVLIFAIAVMVFLGREQQRGVENQLIQLARTSMQASEFVLAAQLAALDGLVALAAADDLEAFRDQARRLLDNRPEWHAIALDSTGGETIARHAGTEAPQLPPLEAASEPLPGEDGAGTVTARVASGGSGRHFLLLRAPVNVDGGPDRAIRAALDLAPFSRALSTQLVPEGWIAAVIDPVGLIAGRSRAEGEFVGSPATSSLMEEVRAANENFFYSLNKEGERVYTAFATSAATGWTAAVGAPASIVEAPLRRSRLLLAGGGAAAVALALLLAWLLTRNVLQRQEAERRALRLQLEQQTENRLSDIAAHFPGVIYRRVLHPDGRVSYPYMSSRASMLVGDDLPRQAGLPATLEELARDYILPEDHPKWRAAIDESARNLTPYDVEGRLRRPDGAINWVRSIASTRLAEDGSVLWDGVVLNVTELKEAEQALRARTSALQSLNRINIQIAGELDLDRLVQSALDAATDISQAAFGAFFYNVHNEHGDSYTLYQLSGVKREAFADFPMPRSTKVFGPTFRGEGIVRVGDITRDPRYGQNAPYHGMPEGHLPVRSYLAVPVISRSGEVLGGMFFGHPEPDVFTEDAARIVSGIASQTAVAMDNARLFKAAEDEIAQRRRSEEHQKMLLSELNHRVKNTLAVVLAIAQQTAKSSRSLEDFNEVYRGRLHALANAHSLLTDANWEPAPLRALLEQALEPYGEAGTARIGISGPPVIVPPKQALALSLVFHELATNASKYGALSDSGGRVAIDWAVDDEADAIRFRWEEFSAHPVARPKREGFGSRLIELNVSYELGGSVRRDFAPSGFVCEIVLPWDAQSGELTPREPQSAEKTSRGAG